VPTRRSALEFRKGASLMCAFDATVNPEVFFVANLPMIKKTLSFFTNGINCLHEPKGACYDCLQTTQFALD